ELAGEVEADTVEISGRVRDRTMIRARSLEVSLSVQKGGMQVVFGECELAVGDEPNKEAAIAAAATPPSQAEAVKHPVPAKAAPAGEGDEPAHGNNKRRRPATQPPPL
ncbi:MAG TPA: hypothetical protein VF469_07745, partial [Kofleriaceae bacterium]